MSREREVVDLPRAERLRDSKRQPTSMSLPLAIHHRLDVLAEAAEDAGATRAELIGMLIALAEPDPAALEAAVLRYRKLRVGDVVPEKQPDTVALPGIEEDNVVSISVRGPGRPAKRGVDR